MTDMRPPFENATRRLHSILHAPPLPDQEIERVRGEIRETCGTLLTAIRSELHEDEELPLLVTIKVLIRSFRKSALPRELKKEMADQLEGILAAIPCEPDATAADAERDAVFPILHEILQRKVSLPPLIEEIRWSEAVLTEKAKALRGADTIIRSTEEDIEGVQMKYAAQELLVRKLIERFGPELLLPSVDNWPKFLDGLSHAVDHITNDPNKSWQYTIDVFYLLTEEIVMDYLRQLPPDEQGRIGEAFKGDEKDAENFANELLALHPDLEPFEHDAFLQKWYEDFHDDLGSVADSTTEQTGYSPPNQDRLPDSLTEASYLITHELRDLLFPKPGTRT
ncbi:MAG: hypothetical protein AAB728_05790 [Patescibacteria group bacterium]